MTGLREGMGVMRGAGDRRGKRTQGERVGRVRGEGEGVDGVRGAVGG